MMFNLPLLRFNVNPEFRNLQKVQSTVEDGGLKPCSTKNYFFVVVVPTRLALAGVFFADDGFLVEAVFFEDDFAFLAGVVVLAFVLLGITNSLLK